MNNTANIHKSDTSSDAPYVIVIGRQYGSGGRRIGKYLADALGIDYYDKTLLSEAARRLGYSEEIFKRKDERRPSVIRSLLSFTYGAPTGFNDSSLSDESLYRAQSEVIKELCGKGSCVIVGRTADYVMRDNPRLLSIFLHAPMEHRVKRILEREETDDPKKAKELAEKTDSDREGYYNYYTNRRWGYAPTYHLSLDSSRIAPEDILGIVKLMLGI